MTHLVAELLARLNVQETNLKRFPVGRAGPSIFQAAFERHALSVLPWTYVETGDFRKHLADNTLQIAISAGRGVNHTLRI